MTTMNTQPRHRIRGSDAPCLSFSVAYAGRNCAAEGEQCFGTMNEALDFCVRLSCLDGQPLCVTQRFRGVDDAVLEGVALTTEIARRRGLRLVPGSPPA
jgi:hypothetical protein